MNDQFVVGFTPRASREVAEAKRWWRANRTKAPDALEEELRTTTDLLGRTPNIGAVARNVALPDVKRIFLNRVNYFLTTASMPNRASLKSSRCGMHAGARVRACSYFPERRTSARDNITSATNRSHA